RGLAEVVDAAMDVGVLRAVVILQRIEDGVRLVRGRAVIEIDQRLAVNLGGEDREVGAHLLDVESGARLGFQHAHGESYVRCFSLASPRSVIRRSCGRPAWAAM